MFFFLWLVKIKSKRKIVQFKSFLFLIEIQLSGSKSVIYLKGQKLFSTICLMFKSGFVIKITFFNFKIDSKWWLNIKCIFQNLLFFLYKPLQKKIVFSLIFKLSHVYF